MQRGCGLRHKSLFKTVRKKLFVIPRAKMQVQRAGAIQQNEKPFHINDQLSRSHQQHLADNTTILLATITNVNSARVFLCKHTHNNPLHYTTFMIRLQSHTHRTQRTSKAVCSPASDSEIGRRRIANEWCDNCTDRGSTAYTIANWH